MSKDLVQTVNTDRELWRGPDEGCGDYYADRIFVTEGGGIGIDCGGSVMVRPLREWHRVMMEWNVTHHSVAASAAPSGDRTESSPRSPVVEPK